MIILKAHGRDWILRMCDIEIVYCPDCDSTKICFDTPELETKAETKKYWFGCLCKKCNCTFRVEYEERR